RPTPKRCLAGLGLARETIHYPGRSGTAGPLSEPSRARHRALPPLAVLLAPPAGDASSALHTRVRRIGSTRAASARPARRSERTRVGAPVSGGCVAVCACRGACARAGEGSVWASARRTTVVRLPPGSAAGPVVDVRGA